MFALIPIALSIGMLYLLGERLLYRRLHRWLFIIVATIATWTIAGISIWNQVGLGYFMQTTDVLGNPINWFDGNLGNWIAWMSSTVGIAFATCTILTYLVILPFAHSPHWWEFWKK